MDEDQDSRGVERMPKIITNNEYTIIEGLDPFFIISKLFNKVIEQEKTQKVLKYLGLIETLSSKKDKNKLSSDIFCVIDLTGNSSELLRKVTDFKILLREYKEVRETFDSLKGHLIVFSALQAKYELYQSNKDEKLLLFCSNAIQILGNTFQRHNDQNLLGSDDQRFAELIIEMLDKQESFELINEICYLICVMAMLKESKVLNEKRTFEALLKVGKRAKETNNELTVQLVLRALRYCYFHYDDSDIEYQTFNIEGVLEFTIPFLEVKPHSATGKWLETRPKLRRVVHNIAYMLDIISFRQFIFDFLRPIIYIRWWDYCWNRFVCKHKYQDKLRIISEYLKVAIWEAEESGFFGEEVLWRMHDNDTIYRLTEKYPPVKFSPKCILDDPSFTFSIQRRTAREFASFDFTKKKFVDSKNKELNYDYPEFYREYENFHPYMEPTIPHWIGILEEAHRLLRYLSNDQFFQNKRSMSIFREKNIFGLLTNQFVDHIDLPLEIPREKRTFLQQLSCQTIWNVIGDLSDDRGENIEWKQLLDESSKWRPSLPDLIYYNYRQGELFKEKDNNHFVFYKLLRTGGSYKKNIDGLVRTTFGFFILISFLLIFEKYLIYREPFPNKYLSNHNITSSELPNNLTYDNTFEIISIFFAYINGIILCVMLFVFFLFASTFSNRLYRKRAFFGSLKQELSFGFIYLHPYFFLAFIFYQHTGCATENSPDNTAILCIMVFWGVNSFILFYHFLFHRFFIY